MPRVDVVVDDFKLVTVEFLDFVDFFQDASVPVFEDVLPELRVLESPVLECVVEVVFHHLPILRFDGVRHKLLPVAHTHFDG